MSIFTKIPKIYIICIAFFLFLQIGNDSPLYDQDEAAYAGFAKRMLNSGDFILQEFPFSTPHRKPPLHFWLTTISFYTLGISEFSLRFLPSVWIVLTCLLTFNIAKLKFNKGTAYFSFLILATSIYFPLNGKIALVDGLLTFMETLGFYSLFKLYDTRNKKSSVGWIIVFWISITLGTLTKGPPILIFLGGICLLLLAYKETRVTILRLRPWFFLPIALLPLLVWGYLIWIKTDGEMVRWMLDWYVFRRATSPVFGQSGPPGTYLFLFLITLFPWSFYLTDVLKSIWGKLKSVKSRLTNRHIILDSWDILIIGGLLFGWVFYEVLMSKLPSYPLAAYPILAILLGNAIDKSPYIRLKELLTGISVLQIVLINLFFLFYLNEKRADTRLLALKWNQSIPISEPVYALKNYALPSLAFYLNHEIRIYDDLIAINKMPPNVYLILDPESLLILTHLGIRGDILSPATTIWEYDRNKKIDLILFKTKSD